MTVLAGEDMDGDMANSCFGREGAGLDVPANFEPAVRVDVEFVE